MDEQARIIHAHSHMILNSKCMLAAKRAGGSPFVDRAAAKRAGNDTFLTLSSTAVTAFPKRAKEASCKRCLDRSKAMTLGKRAYERKKCPPHAPVLLLKAVLH